MCWYFIYKECFVINCFYVGACNVYGASNGLYGGGPGGRVGVWYREIGCGEIVCFQHRSHYV